MCGSCVGAPVLQLSWCLCCVSVPANWCARQAEGLPASLADNGNPQRCFSMASAAPHQQAGFRLVISMWLSPDALALLSASRLLDLLSALWPLCLCGHLMLVLAVATVLLLLPGVATHGVSCHISALLVAVLLYCSVRTIVTFGKAANSQKPFLSPDPLPECWLDAKVAPVRSPGLPMAVNVCIPHLLRGALG